VTENWFSAAPVAMQSVATPVFAILVIALTVFGAIALYRMATGKSIGGREDD
jgi:hypothetical protein